jgi:hypothetical protein
MAINGKSFTISKNLDSALRDVISMWKKTYGLHGKPLFLWCDQICINQSHNEEKNHQVAFMRTIYERPKKSWYGCRSMSLMDLMSTFNIQLLLLMTV